MKEVDEIIRRVYYFSDDEIKNMTTLKLAQKFSQYYKIPMHLFKDGSNMKQINLKKPDKLSSVRQANSSNTYSKHTHLYY